MNAEKIHSHDRRAEDKGKVDISFWGVKVSIDGHELIKSLFLLSIFLLLAVGLYFHDKNTVASLNEMVKAQEALIYVTQLPQDKKDLLHLDKPELIKRMEREGR